MSKRMGFGELQYFILSDCPTLQLRLGTLRASNMLEISYTSTLRPFCIYTPLSFQGNFLGTFRYVIKSQ